MYGRLYINIILFPMHWQKGLNSTKSKMLGILLSYADSPFYSKLLVECEKAANAKGNTILMCVDAIIILEGSMDSYIIDEEKQL